MDICLLSSKDAAIAQEMCAALAPLYWYNFERVFLQTEEGAFLPSHCEWFATLAFVDFANFKIAR